MKIKILALTGYKHSGKDSLYKELVNQWCNNEWMQDTVGFTRVAFADALKNEVAVSLGITVEEIEANKEQFRLLLQAWGDVKKLELLGNDRTYWSNKAANSLVFYLADDIDTAKRDGKEFTRVVVVTDLRYPFEIADFEEHLTKLANKLSGDTPITVECKVVRVLNDQVALSDTHSSETSVNEIVPDFIVQNSWSKDFGGTGFNRLDVQALITNYISPV